MAFYIKRNFVDNGPGIEMVNIHYTWTSHRPSAGLGSPQRNPLNATRAGR